MRIFKVHTVGTNFHVQPMSRITGRLLDKLITLVEVERNDVLFWGSKVIIPTRDMLSTKDIRARLGVRIIDCDDDLHAQSLAFSIGRKCK